MSERAGGSASVPLGPLQWFPEFWKLSRRRLASQVRELGLALLVGVCAGVVAIIFHYACDIVAHFSLDLLAGYRPSGPGGEHSLFEHTDTPFRPWMLLLIPTVGGLISGWLVFTFAPEAEGHGTDAAIRAYHHKEEIRPRVPLIKVIASALTINTGGSGGREGPIAQAGAGVGSLLGRIFNLPPAEKRVLLAAGVAAGVSAMFRAPLAGALFAAEVLYSSPEFESEVILPGTLASVTASCTIGLVLGWQPIFSIPPELVGHLALTSPVQLLPYTVLALSSAVLAMLYTRSFQGASHSFRQMRLPRMFRPAVGAFVTGAIGLLLYGLLAHGHDDMRPLAVLSTGYGLVQKLLVPVDVLLQDHTSAWGWVILLLGVAVGKIMTTDLTIGSGGSGGVFGPSLVIGGCGGGALGLALHTVAPWLVPQPASFVLVGMAGFFAAAAKTPFSTLFFVVEMTGGYELLLPALWVCVLSFLLSDQTSLYESQVESRSRSPAHQGSFAREVLGGLTIRPFLRPLGEVPVLRAADRLADVVERLAQAEHGLAPVVHREDGYLGVVTLEEALVALRSPDLAQLVVAADMVRTDVPTLGPDDRLDQAMELFVECDLLALPVLGGGRKGKLVGLVRRADLAATYLRQVTGNAPMTGAAHPS